MCLRPTTLLKKRQVFSCEFWEISKNTFSYRTPLVTALYITHLISKCMISKGQITVEPLSNNKVTDLLLQNTYGACF